MSNEDMEIEVDKETVPQTTREEVQFMRGISNLWTSVNHVALVVSDVGRSLAFYTDVLGMKQVIRPNFDRHGAWLTMGNLDLHLIKGRPAVHRDDDLIVSHIAISVNNMVELRRRLKIMNVPSRKNVSVPNPADKDSGIVDQAFLRDPDGYYIELANCESLEHFILTKMAEGEKNWNLRKTSSVLTASQQMKKIAAHSKLTLSGITIPNDINLQDTHQDEQIDSTKLDHAKLSNLVKRRKIYGDITQNATEEDLEDLMITFDNHVPSVIAALEARIRAKGTRTYIPPAFYGRDGSFVQPPSFEMNIESIADTLSSQ